MTMTKVFTDVSVFMKACGQNHPHEPTEKDDDLSKLYKVLIDEEYDEFIKAWEENNDTEKIDACFDMIWVITGYMKSRGWDCEKIWDEGAYSNLSKIDKKTGKVIRREDGKILKPDGWKKPNFEQFTK
jgi:predicted HAD superfamily Cof-like phosphohydrolase